MADEMEMESVRYSSGFKLFGAVIVTDKRRTNKGSEAGEPENDNMTAAAAAAATVAEEGEVSPALLCPRCKSQETKFCYFNNYNVNQPRHLCKACHRYWTAGGAIRNVPVGGGRRQNRQAR